MIIQQQTYLQSNIDTISRVHNITATPSLTSCLQQNQYLRPVKINQEDLDQVLARIPSNVLQEILNKQIEETCNKIIAIPPRTPRCKIGSQIAFPLNPKTSLEGQGGNHAQQIRLGTFNIGSGSRDYARMVHADSSQLTHYQTKLVSRCSRDEQALMQKTECSREEQIKLDAATQKAQQTQTQAVEELTATRLADQLDVICLQEVYDKNRAFIRTLESKGFTLCYDVFCSDGFSTAIALKTSLVSGINNISIQTPEQGQAVCGQEITAVEVTLKQTNTPIAIASLHSWGFKLYSPDFSGEKIGDANDSAKKAKANGYIKQATSLLRSQNATYSIMTGDMNNNPENYPDTFRQIQNSGYSTLTPNADTNVNPDEPDYLFRKIDFIFTQQLSLIQRIIRAVKSIFCETTYVSASPATVPEDFPFTVEGNCSDHKPVFTTITITKQSSYLSRLWMAVRKCFCF